MMAWHIFPQLPQIKCMCVCVTDQSQGLLNTNIIYYLKHINELQHCSTFLYDCEHWHV